MSTKASLTINKETLTVRDAVFDLLRELGMRTVLGNPGSTELAFLTPCPEGFRYVLALQEASAAAMADAYAQATGNVAFVNLHSAAGAWQCSQRASLKGRQIIGYSNLGPDESVQ